jgi:hypothetical protein
MEPIAKKIEQLKSEIDQACDRIGLNSLQDELKSAREDMARTFKS